MLKSFAEDLKSIRKEKNISLKDISSSTRLNVSILENLENGEFSFQPQTYIRAFLKQYIISIGLDPEEVLFDYDLARSGKYKSKRQNAPAITENSVSGADEKVQRTESRENKIRIADKLKVLTESPKKLVGELKNLKPDDNKESAADKTTGSSDSNPMNKLSISTSDEKTGNTSVNAGRESSFSFSFLNSTVFRNIFLIIVILLVLLGLYSLVNMLFFDGKKDKPEVIRQNFDDVVKEQERKILGKRTQEEIQDSIRKAEEDFAASRDSIVLKITSSGSGIVFISADSVNYGKPDKIQFEKNMSGTFKAKRFFHISTVNTESFKATVNNTPVKFPGKSVSKIKITRDGVVK